MPCPANELGIVEAFIGIENSKANIGSAVSMDGACVLMARSGTAPRTQCGICDMPCPYWEKTTTGTKNVVAAAPSIGDRGVFLRWHRQECLCYW